jgi:hypothetical protein
MVDHAGVCAQGGPLTLVGTPITITLYLLLVLTVVITLIGRVRARNRTELS